MPVVSLEPEGLLIQLKGMERSLVLFRRKIELSFAQIHEVKVFDKLGQHLNRNRILVGESGLSARYEMNFSKTSIEFVNGKWLFWSLRRGKDAMHIITRNHFFSDLFLSIDDADYFVTQVVLALQTYNKPPL